ncbi:MAG: LIC_10190 family membrane protein, partial [Lachnospiraceae bacterium]
KTHTGLVLLAIVLIIAFYSSRGTFHTDTGIYHAAAIRFIERYGVIKGLANLQLHYGYNSAYLVLCAFFSYAWLPGIGANAGGTLALHTLTGFIACFASCYAALGLRHWKAHRLHLADAARIALLLYVLTNACGLMSPATDYGTLLFSHLLLSFWLDVVEERAERGTAGDRRLRDNSYGYLCVLALFLVSMKLSAAAMVLLVLYPLVRLVRTRRGKAILAFLLLGFVSFVPFLIRNVILSGWLFYPFEAIDLFSVPWKVPVAYSLVDSAQIKVWGRCLYDITKVNLPMREWIPVWWDGQYDYDQMLLYALMASVPMFVIDLFLLRKNRIRLRDHLDAVLLAASLYVSVGVWFVTAPFVRYGLAFLLTTPLLSVSLFFSLLRGKRSFWKAPGIFVALFVLIGYCSWIDHYTNDDLSFVKQQVKEPWYLVQKPYPGGENESTMTVDGVTFYVAGTDEVNSYYAFPGTCYNFMLERTKLLGDSIEDGFAPK